MKSKEILASTEGRYEAIRFIAVGGFATILQYGIYVVFVNTLMVPAVVSSLISYAISFVANYFLSSYFTFKSNPNAKNGIAFTLSHLINMGMQTGLVAVFKGLVGPTFALLPALAICIPVNFFLVRFAFKSKYTKRK